MGRCCLLRFEHKETGRGIYPLPVSFGPACIRKPGTTGRPPNPLKNMNYNEKAILWMVSMERGTYYMTKKRECRMAAEVLKSTAKAQRGACSADSILKELLDASDYETAGLAAEVIQIWNDAEDKESVERLFCLFTGCEFRDWVDRCIRETK